MISTNFVPPNTEEYLNFLKLKKNSQPNENSRDQEISKRQSSLSKNILDSNLCFLIEKIVCNFSEKIKSQNIKISQINKDYIGLYNFINRICFKLNIDSDLIYNHFKNSKCDCKINVNRICKEINEIYETFISNENNLQKSIGIDLTSEESENEREKIQARNDQNIIEKQSVNESNEIFGEVEIDPEFETFFIKKFDYKTTQNEEARKITFLVEPLEETKVYNDKNFQTHHDNNKNISHESSNNECNSKKRSRQNSLEINNVTDSRESDRSMKHIQKIKKVSSNPRKNKSINKKIDCKNFKSIASKSIEYLKSNNSRGVMYKNVKWITTKKKLFETMAEKGDKKNLSYQNHSHNCESCENFVNEHIKK